MTAFILRARRFLRRIDPNDDPHAEPLSVPALLTVLVLTGPLRALHRHLPERHLSLESFYTAGATLREVRVTHPMAVVEVFEDSRVSVRQLMNGIHPAFTGRIGRGAEARAARDGNPWHPSLWRWTQGRRLGPGNFRCGWRWSAMPWASELQGSPKGTQVCGITGPGCAVTAVLPTSKPRPH